MTIYEKYGGYDFFHNTIYELYLDLFDRPEISHHFVGVDIVTLSKHQAQFLCRGVGGPIIYEGQPIKEVHQNMDISLFQFKEVAKAFKEIFLKNGVDPSDAEHIMQFIGRYKNQIVECQESPIDKFMIPIYKIFDFIKNLRRT